MGWKTLTVGALALALAPLTLQAQVIEEEDLPRGLADEIIEFFNDSSTIRFRGRADVPAGRVIQGDVAVLRGPMRVAGRIEGDLIVVNGSLVIVEGGYVGGDVIVVGGTAATPTGAVGGQLVVYDEVLPYERRGDRIQLEPRPSDRERWDYEGPYTRSRISIRVEDSYNRVEGLPVRFGPVLETRGRNYFRADALAIWRSDRGLTLDTEDIGWFVRAEQHFGPQGRFSIGATAHSLITPIERWGLRDIEASLAAFLLHQDYRDYYEREGFSAYARFIHRPSGVRLGIEYRDEEHSYEPVGSPWTLKRNDAPWRPQPLVGEGRLRSIVGELVVDDRNDPEHPSDGWYLSARGRFGIGGGLTLPAYFPDAPTTRPTARPAVDLGYEVRSGFLDLRRYTRLSPSADLKLRGVLAGSLDGEPLPPQFQHALGGEGSLPGYRLLSADCGARSERVGIDRGDEAGTRVPAFRGYGCDRMALFQAEYRSNLSFSIDLTPEDDDWDDEWSWHPGVDFSPAWSVFFNAGRGWSLADEGSARHLGPDTETLMDVGVGLFLGDLGLYWAWPLKGDDKGVNFFIRIDHRF